MSSSLRPAIMKIVNSYDGAKPLVWARLHHVDDPASPFSSSPDSPLRLVGLVELSICAANLESIMITLKKKTNLN